MSSKKNEYIYDVEITETLRRIVSVKAADQYEAEEIAAEGWNQEKYVLDADDFLGVDFHTVGKLRLSNPDPQKESSEFLGQIIDIFQDYLDDRSDDTTISGADYDTLSEKLRNMMLCWDVLSQK